MARTALPAVRRPPLALVAALAALAIIAIPAGTLFAQSQASPYTVVETGQGYARLQQAVDAIGSGRGTIAITASAASVPTKASGGRRSTGRAVRSMRLR